MLLHWLMYFAFVGSFLHFGLFDAIAVHITDCYWRMDERNWFYSIEQIFFSKKKWKIHFFRILEEKYRKNRKSKLTPIKGKKKVHEFCWQRGKRNRKTWNFWMYRINKVTIQNFNTQLTLHLKFVVFRIFAV